jgi:hypothetical protein
MRIALRYREQPFQDVGAMIKAFFEWRDLQPLEDYLYTYMLKYRRILAEVDAGVYVTSIYFGGASALNSSLDVFKFDGIGPVGLSGSRFFYKYSIAFLMVE